MIKIKKYQIEDYVSDATQDALDLKADLIDGKVPASQLPSFVDDVIEVANYAALPVLGSSGVIYITLDTNKVYRWSGSVYIEIASGVTNLSYTPGVSNGTVNSDTGYDATIPLAGTVNAGLFLAAEKSKLEGIAAGAEVNVNADWNAVSGDAQILNKPTIPSISGLATVTYVDTQDALKVDKIIGKGLSTEDYTTTEKNKLAAITGTNTGDQDLQSVTTLGATTTKGITITVGDGGGDGIHSFSSQGYGIYGSSSETYGVYGTSASAAGVYGISGNYGVHGYSEGVGVYGDSTNSVGVGGNSFAGTGMYASSDSGTGLYSYSESGTGISAYSNSIGLEVNGNGTIAIKANLGNSNKGLVINSGTSSTGNPIVIDKNGVEKLVVNQEGELTATKLIKEGGFDFQFLKADGSVDNNTYLTSADLPSTLDLYATTSPDPVISGYTALVRNITDIRYNTTAVDVPTPLVDGTIASPTFCGAVISDPSVLLGNPGVFNFSVIGKIRRTGGSTSSGADFFFSIYKRDISGVETKIADSSPVVVPANGGIYVEYISIALWNNGIFLSTDRVVLKFYGIKTGGGSGASYEFLFGGDDPVRGTASISSAIIPNIYLRDLADVEKIDALNNEVLYWNDAASLWEHSLVENLVPDASATQKGLVSIGLQTFAGSKTFSSQTILGDGVVGTPTYGLLPQATVGSTTGGVFDIRNTNANIVAGNTVGTLQFSAKDDNSIAYSTAQIKAITQNGIGTGGSGKTDLIFYTSNGSSSIERVKMNDLGLVINSEVTSTIASFDSNKSIKSLTTADGYPSLVELKYVKGVTSAIQTQLNGKVDENTAITGATKTKITYDSKGLVTAGADIATTDISDFNSATRAQVEAELVAGTNITITPSGTGATRQLTIDASGGGSSTQSAFTVLANNTNASALPTEQVFRNEPSKAYAGATPTWTGSTAPSGTTDHTYSWSRVGNLVTLRVSLDYSTAGTSVTQVIFDLPGDCPTPELPSGVSNNLDVISYGSSMLAGNRNVPAAPTATYSAIRIKSTGVYEIIIGRNSANYRYAYATIQYFTT